jgi:hypothetical protein
LKGTGLSVPKRLDFCQGMTLELAEKWALAIDLCQGMTSVVPKK